MAITTVEALSDGMKKDAKMHPIQEHLAKKHGTQCGYCTPGIVMALTAVAASNPKPTMLDVEECLDANLCRCTGYRPILEAAHAMAVDYDASKDGKLSKEAGLEGMLNGRCAADLVSDIVTVPAELRAAPRPLRIVNARGAWIRPTTLEALAATKAGPAVPASELPAGVDAASVQAPKLISGNTEIGYKVRYHSPAKPVFATYVSTFAVPELHTVTYGAEAVEIGSGCTINEFSEALFHSPAEHNPRAYAPVVADLKRFANNQVRNMGTVGGSLVTCDPLSDLYPVLVALRATVHIRKADGAYRDVAVEELVAGQNAVHLEQAEVIVSVRVPYIPAKDVYMQTYKEAKRRLDSQAVVNAGFRVALNGATHAVESAVLSVGAISRRAGQRLPKTEAFLAGKEWCEATVIEAMRVMRAECEELVVKSRGLTEYKLRVAPSLLYRFHVYVCKGANIPLPQKAINTDVDEHEHATHHGQQDYNAPWDEKRPIGRPVMHLAAQQHVTGTATFVADEPFSGYYGAYVLAKRGHAKILSIKRDAALKMPGVIGVYTAEDIPGENLIGSIIEDEEVLASKEVRFFAQPIAIVVANSHREAQAAAKLVEAEYEDLPLVSSIEDAIAAGDYLCPDHELTLGDYERVFAETPAERIVSGEVRVGGQEHFYIEPQACTVWPSNDKYVVHTTIQNPTKAQYSVAKVIGKPFHMVESSMIRIGGGFGGKQDRPQFLAAATAIAAYNAGKPVRIVLERDQDMQITGQRHEFLVRYKAAFRPDGFVEALDAQLYNNGGFTMDLSPSVMEVALFAIDNCYQLPNRRLIGRCCRTNRPSCTAYRGFGKPQGIAAIESILDHVARASGVDVMEVRAINRIHTGDKLIDDEHVDECFEKCWDPLYALYKERKPEVDRFNMENRWRKRGLALVPAKNNIGFETYWMNQGGAFVAIYQDGSVYATHGGTEMGQGLNTKVAQATADGLGIPLERVTVGRSATESVPNTHPTAACTGTELNVGSIIDAVAKLNERLNPLRAEMEKAAGKPVSWDELILEAYHRRISLSAEGHYHFPRFEYDWETKTGRASFYRIWGAALSEVELDVISGSWRIVRTDIVQDNGKGINPAIDLGQVEGGFVQGVGLFTLEELLWAADGHLRTRNVSTYKIPTHDDIPIEFNVQLLKNVDNPRAVYGNKTVGEAGLQLGLAVVHAIKQAIYAARIDVLGKEKEREFFVFNTPTTVEKIRLACPNPYDEENK